MLASLKTSTSACPHRATDAESELSKDSESLRRLRTARESLSVPQVSDASRWSAEEGLRPLRPRREHSLLLGNDTRLGRVVDDLLAGLDIPRLLVVPNEPNRLLSLEGNGSRQDFQSLLEAAGYELSRREPVVRDPAIRELLDHDHFYLFSRP